MSDSEPCPDCGADLSEVQVGGDLFGYCCRSCLTVWIGVTGLEIRWEHPETERMGPETAASGGVRP